MSQVTSQTKSWTKPEFKRLGQIKDVAGPNGGVIQNSNKS